MPPKKKGEVIKLGTSPYQPISTYYQDKYFTLLDENDFSAFDKVKAEFLKDLASQSKAQLVDFLYLVKNCGEKFAENELENLVRKTNELIISDPQISFKESILVLEAFVKTKVEKYQLKDLPISRLAALFNGTEDLSSDEIGRFFKACARIGYDERELGINASKLVGDINLQFSSFSVGQKITLLNSLAALGYDSSGVLENSLNKISRDVLQNYEKINPDQFAAFTHSLTKMAMIDYLFSSSVAENRRDFLTPEKTKNLSSDAAFSLLQAHMYCDLLYQRSDLFDAETLQAISGKYNPAQAETSALQKKVKKSLEKRGYKITEEFPLYEVNGKPIRSVDLRLEGRNQTSSLEYFIEVDGPTHFLLPAASRVLTADHNTQIRDYVNQLAIKSKAKDTLSECKYVSVSFAEIENCRGEISDFILEKIAATKNIDLNGNPIPTATAKVSTQFASLRIEDTAIFPPLENPNKISNKILPKSLPIAVAEVERVKVIVEVSKLERAIIAKNLKAIKAEIRSGVDVNAKMSNGLSPFDFAVQRAEDNEMFGVIDADYMRIYSALVNAGAVIEEKPAEEKVAAETRGKKKKAKEPENSLKKIYDQSATKEHESLFCALSKLNSVTLDHNTIRAALNSKSAKIVEALTEKDGFNVNHPEVVSAFHDLVKKVSEEKIVSREEIRILDIIAGKSEVNSESFEIRSTQTRKNLLLKSIQFGEFLSLDKLCLAKQEQLTEKDRLAIISKASIFSVMHVLESCSLEEKYIPFFIFMATSFDKKEVIDFMISKGGDINATNSATGITALSCATLLNKHEMVKFLLTKENIAVDARNITETTPLILACDNGLTPIAETLIAHGANVDLDDETCVTPMLAAVNGDFKDTVEFLLSLEKDGKRLIKTDDIKASLKARQNKEGIDRAKVAKGAKGTIVDLTVRNEIKELLENILKEEEVGTDITKASAEAFVPGKEKSAVIKG